MRTVGRDRENPHARHRRRRNRLCHHAACNPPQPSHVTPRVAPPLPAGTVTFLFTDIEGSTRLWEAQPAAMQVALARHDELLSHAIESCHGRVFKTAGDAFCAVFVNAHEAVTAAVEAQRSLRTDVGPASVPIRVRIALHSGDAQSRDRDYFGPTLNLVARLLAAAHGGQTLTTAATHELCRSRMPPGATMRSLGEHMLKDIGERQVIYEVLHSGVVEAFPPLATLAESAVSTKPSIAVLPFTNLSGDPEQAYFANGVVDDIITALSRVRAFFVIGRTSSFTFGDQPVDVGSVGRELGVRYVLRGSVRRAGNRVRINGQLIEAESGRHLWGDRFEGALDDIFDLQDRITECVVGAIEPNLRLAEIERARSKRTCNLSAYDYALRAWHRLSLDSTPEGIGAALDELRQAIALDPGYSLAKAWFGWAIQLLGSVQGAVDEAQTRIAVQMAREALAAHHDDPVTLATAAWVLCYLDSAYDEALDAAGRALTIAPDVAVVLNHAGWVQAFAGDPRDAIRTFRRAIHVSPLDPQRAHLLQGLAIALQRAGDYEAAHGAAATATLERPNAQRVLLLSLMALGRVDEGRTLAQRMLKTSPGTTITWFRSVPFRDQAFKERSIAAMRAAGIPE
jgi:adenylate cyclase